MDKLYRVLYDFEAQGPTEISCKKDEIVTGLSAQPNNGWLQIKVSRPGTGLANASKQGLIPFSYLAEIPRAVPTHRPAPPPPVPRAAPSAPPLPSQPSPTVSMAPEVKNVAVEHAECAICYDEMTSQPSSVLINAGGKRPCRHFLHKSCAEGLLRANQKTCPICRAPFVKLADVPDFDANPKNWFGIVDANGDGTLSKGEVIEIMKATMAIDYKALEKNVDNLWPRWDHDGSGEIDFNELCHPKLGLLVYVRAHFARIKREPPPELNIRNLEIWFTYWDEDGNGSLEKEEILRALIKTFKLSSTPARLKEMREMLDVLWPLFDSDGSGEVELGEFIARDGLGESLCASMAAGR